MKLIDKDKVVAEIEKRKSKLQSRITELGTFESNTLGLFQDMDLYDDILSFLNTLEVREVNLGLENENNNPKITVGTKIRSKTNPDIILTIISDDCHEDEFECSNGSVLSLKQIEKYYDLIIK